MKITINIEISTLGDEEGRCPRSILDTLEALLAQGHPHDEPEFGAGVDDSEL